LGRKLTGGEVCIVGNLIPCALVHFLEQGPQCLPE
jgi:hypothetical protein